MQGDHLIILVVHIHGSGHYLCKMYRSVRPVRKRHRTGYHVLLFKYAVCKNSLQSERAVLCVYLKTLAVLFASESRRKSGQSFFAAIYVVALVCKIDRRTAACRLYFNSSFSVIAKPVSGVLGGKKIKKRTSLPRVLRRHERSLLCSQQISHILIADFRAIIAMPDKFLLVGDPYHIACIFRIKLEA